MYYQYLALDSNNQRITGEVEANSEEEVINALKKEGLSLLYLTPKTKFQLNIPFLGGVPLKDRALFFRELAILIKAGIPLVNGLETLSTQSKNKTLAKALALINGEVKGGSPLSVAFKKHPKIFPPLIVNLVATGEKSGKLEEILFRIADQLEKQHELNIKIRGALIYPILILVALIIVLTIIFVFIIPQLKKIFDEINIVLPLPTRIVLGTSDFVLRFGFLIVIVFAILLFLVQLGKKFLSIKRIVDRLKMKIPIFGPLLEEVYVATFARTLAVLTTSGLPVLQAIETTKGVMTNINYQESLDKVRDAVENGAALSSALAQFSPFPPLLSSLIKVGEETGELSEVLNSLADFSEREVENTTRNLSATIEPVLTIVMGIGVGLVVASVIMPIYQLVGSI